MKALKYLLRAIGVIAALCLFALGLSVLFYTVVEGIKVLETILGFSAYEGRVIYNAMGILDLILLSFSIFIVAIGIYELFRGPYRTATQLVASRRSRCAQRHAHQNNCPRYGNHVPGTGGRLERRR
jgi:hypothetical protein